MIFMFARCFFYFDTTTEEPKRKNLILFCIRISKKKRIVINRKFLFEHWKPKYQVKYSKKILYSLQLAQCQKSKKSFN